MSESKEENEKRRGDAEPQHNPYFDAGIGNDNTAGNTSERPSNLTPPPAGVGTPYHSTTGAESGSGPHYDSRGGYQMPPPGGQYANYGYYYPPQIQWNWHNGRWYNTPQAEDGTWLVKEDRIMAMLAHLLTLFSGFIGPLIIYLVKRDDSKFTAFHALQALYFEIMIIIVNVVLVILGYGIMFAAISTAGHGGPPHPGLIAGFFLPFFLLFPINIGALIYKIVLCVKSSRGEWARYPIVGMWAFDRVEMRYSRQWGY